jgi:ribonuclease E
MAKRMLIDASHPEETRVVVVDGNQLEDFDFETSTKKQLKGNIYLAKITRVEPSLQAAFVEYGGNRHGFLAFSEIHPDYYQIPVADREALEQEAQEAAQAASTEEEVDEASEEGGDGVEVVGGEETEEVERRERILNRLQLMRRYKIHEVIKKRQIVLVQVVKEERGNKGAALTTYISLAGRYCVLMPNTPRGGGISRKIVKPEDRKRLKAIMGELPIDSPMGVIVRTAGMSRSRAEIKRDFDYLIRLWDEIREITLNSTAPALIHEEGNLIKRSIRDLYTGDIQEILVEGEEGYRTAKDFMRAMIPSHARRVHLYSDRIPLLHRYQIEGQLDAMHSAQVPLKSGGYIVFDSAEALVAIDVNSGRATKERNIEETATKTNLEAADEIGRQLRLRDLAGLIVIDFIDMDDPRNDRKVEKRFKDAVKTDRARIQLGKISSFGLLELSRQRLRPSFLEASTQTCAACQGTGNVRSVESSSLQLLRAIEGEGLRERSTGLEVTLPDVIALYILNHKRAALAEIEERYGFHVSMVVDDSLPPSTFRIEPLKAPVAGEETRAESEGAKAVPEAEAAERGKKRGRRRQAAKPAEAAVAEADEAAEEAATDEVTDSRDEPPRAKRRRRGKRGGRRRASRTAPSEEPMAAREPDDAAPSEEPIVTSEPDDAAPSEEPIVTGGPDDATGADEAAAEPAGGESSETVEAKPTPRRRRRAPAAKKKAAKQPRKKRPRTVASEKPASEEGGELPPVDSDESGPPVGRKVPAADTDAVEESVTLVRDPHMVNEDKRVPRRGWWQKG